MSKLEINTFIKPMTGTRATGEVAGESFRIDLETKLLILAGQYIRLESLPANYGGKRWYFVCTLCKTRRRVLYGELGLMACGECQGIYRRTRNRTKTDCQYYWGLAIREIHKVDPDYKLKREYVEYDDFPPRPKWMRFQKYMAHRFRFRKYMDKGVMLWLGRW